MAEGNGAEERTVGTRCHHPWLLQQQDPHHPHFGAEEAEVGEGTGPSSQSLQVAKVTPDHLPANLAALNQWES